MLKLHSTEKLMYKMTKVQSTKKQSCEDTVNVELVKFPGISMFGTKCGWLDPTFLALTEDGKLLTQHRRKPAMVSAIVSHWWNLTQGNALATLN